MRETAAELERLQRLIDDSAERASPFLRASFEFPEHSLTAAQLAAHLQGTLTIALGTVTARGEPRVAPIGAIFVHGAFCVPTVAQSSRARNLQARPAASLTYYEGVELAVIAHGHATLIGAEHDDFAELDQIQVQSGSQSPIEWSGDAVYIRLAPSRLFTYARDPSAIQPRP